MSEKKIEVPDGMYKAALKFQDSGIQCSAALEAALLWQRENHIEPTEAQIELFLRGQGIKDTGYYFSLLRSFGLYFQSRMYDAPEPNVHPVLKEWLEDCKAKGVDEATRVNYRRLFERAFEAGREAGPK